VLVAHISGHLNGNFPLRTSPIVSVDMLGAASHAKDAETEFVALIEGGVNGEFNGHWLVTCENKAQGGETRHFAGWLWVQKPVLTAFDIWWHMRRNQILSFGEIDESIKSAGASVQSITGSRGVCIGGSNAGYIMFRGSEKGSG
jgi:hypothetical protein